MWFDVIWLDHNSQWNHNILHFSFLCVQLTLPILCALPCDSPCACLAFTFACKLINYANHVQSANFLIALVAETVCTRVKNMICRCHSKEVHLFQLQPIITFRQILQEWLLCAVVVRNCRNAVFAFRCVFSHIRCEYNDRARIYRESRSCFHMPLPNRIQNVQRKFNVARNKRNESSRECDIGMPWRKMVRDLVDALLVAFL